MEDEVASFEPVLDDNNGPCLIPKVNFEDVKIEDLTPLSQEVMGGQATINIGTIGHVAHGKSTVVKAISGVKTQRYKNEMERNITIKLGYANAKLYMCTNPQCQRPGRYSSSHSGRELQPLCEIPGCGHKMQLMRHVSFVDCPGHDILMATMLNGAAVMDAALLLVAANEHCPQPQTSEHLAAVEIMKLKNVIILQNKIDLVKESVAKAQYRDIREFINGTVAENSPIIPISAQLGYNIDVIVETLIKKIPIPTRDFLASPRLIVIRSFDVNKPGTLVENLNGGVAGGSITQGVFKLGHEIEIRPGVVWKTADQEIKCQPIRSKIRSLHAERNPLTFAVPGGLIGVGTSVDPTLTRADRLVGHVVGEIGKMPEVYVELEIEFYLLRQLLGVRAAGTGANAVVEKLTPREVIMVNIGSTTTAGNVIAVKKDLAKVTLTTPVCTSPGERLALSRRVDKHWRLIGWGRIRRGVSVQL